MSSSDKIAKFASEPLAVVRYPDPRLAEVCSQVDVFDDALRDLADRMFDLMFVAKGVGLAANQVGITIQMFVASPTFERDDKRIYVNPKLIDAQGWEENEEGCLSLPGINTNVKRRAVVTIQAQDLAGKVFQETSIDMLARIYQHETDHLGGMLLIDRMGSVAKLAHRKTIRELEEKFADSQEK
jgi:peptide deformylase